MAATWAHIDSPEECASQSCDHSPATWRMESGGTGSFYCSKCAFKIAAAHEPELLACPCCGGEAWRDKASSSDWMHGTRPFWSIRCKACDLRTPAIANPISAVLIWNRRK